MSLRNYNWNQWRRPNSEWSSDQWKTVGVLVTVVFVILELSLYFIGTAYFEWGKKELSCTCELIPVDYPGLIHNRNDDDVANMSTHFPF